MTDEVVDAHPHRRLQQPFLPIDQPEPLLLIQITDRLGQRIDMTRRDVTTRQSPLEQHEQITRLGTQPAQPTLPADNP